MLKIILFRTTISLLLFFALSICVYAQQTPVGVNTGSYTCCEHTPCVHIQGEKALNDHNCLVHGIGCPSNNNSSTNNSSGPSIVGLIRLVGERKAEKKQQKLIGKANEANEANEKGIEYWNKQDWANAVIFFQEAANKNPDNKTIQSNLARAQEQLRLQQYNQQQEQLQIQQNKTAALKMQQSIEAFTQTMNSAPSKGGLDFDGQNSNTVSKGNGLDFIPIINEAPIDKIVKQEQDEFDKMNAVWMVNQKNLIEQRLQEPNKWANSIYNSLEIKEPPLPYKKFSELQPGDVLLIAPDDILGAIINGADRLTSGNGSTASHTVLFLKEVNGKKLFLDNTPGMSDATNGRGPHIINEEQFLKIYGQRDVDVAKPAVMGVAQPLSEEETAKLWAAARKLSIQEISSKVSKSGNYFDKTNYGLWGNNNMVCSVASRWALVEAGRKIPESQSPLKKMLVHFGPADFYNDVQNFIVSPLGVPQSK